MSAVDLVGRLAIPLAIAVVFSLARQHMPASSKERVSIDNATAFAKLQWLVNAGLILVGVSLGLIVYGALVWTNHALALRDTRPAFLLLPSRWMWFFFPFFGALCVTWEVTLRIWMLVGDKWLVTNYEAWSNEKAGFNATRVLRITSLVIAFPIGVMSALALPIHTSLGDRDIAIGHFASLMSLHHPYSEVRSITVAQGIRLRDGRLQKRPSVMLSFADGSTWSSTDNRDAQGKVDPALLSFIKARTDLQVHYVESLSFASHSAGTAK